MSGAADRLGSGRGSNNPQVTLAQAVIQQALMDALGFAPDTANNPKAKKQAKAEALLFWSADSGEWAKMREAWCDAAGLDPEYARQHALKRIAASGGYNAENRSLVQMVAKAGTAPTGGRKVNPAITLRNEQIRLASKRGRSAREIADEFNMKIGTVYDILAGRKRKS